MNKEAMKQLDELIQKYSEVLKQALAERPAHHIEQPLEMVDAYCKAWEKSFTADNPYHTVSMTAEDRKHIEAGLKAALAEQTAQQEPVAWRLWDEDPLGGKDHRWVYYDKSDFSIGFDPVNYFKVEPLYACTQAPPAQPLTDEQIAEMMMKTWGCASIAPRHAPAFARAIEAAHGITKGKT